MDLEKIKEGKSIKELIDFSILNIDKPSGPTSFTISDMIKNHMHFLGVTKTSHFGTLDPQVSGVLPVALNRACRLTKFFMRKDKVYVGIMRLHSDVSDEILRKEMGKFLGKIMQKPPVKSRVRRVEREREVKRFEILERDEKDALFLSDVEAGTYIRKLIDDLGKAVGGAHMLELRRTRAGIFEESRSFTLYQLDEAVKLFKEGDESKLREMLIPGEIIGDIFPVVELKKEFLERAMRGAPLMQDWIIEKKEGEFAVVFCEGRFVEVVKVEGGKVFGRPEFVLN
jgi:H/ACA ribonucleoprotein complex subunit 4